MPLDAKSKKIYLIGGAVGIVVVGWIYLHNKSSAANAAATTGIDPATGFAYGSAQDTAALAAQTSSTEIDPSTGYAYGSAADESALSTESATAQDTGAAYSPVSTSTAAVQTNAAWAQAAQQTLSAVGYDPETISGALGAYLGRIGLSTTQVTIVQAALAEEGPPPQGSYAIIAATSAPTTTTGTTSAYITATPGNLRVVILNTTSVQIQFNPVANATGYGVETYDSSGKVVNGPFTTTNTIANVGGLKSKTKYHTNVWADPAKTGGPHSSVTYTTK